MELKEIKYPEKIDKIKSLFGFPMKIPISFRNKKLGNVKIDFEYDKEVKISSRSKEEKKLFILLGELRLITILLDEDIDRAFRLEERIVRDENKKLQTFLNIFLISPAEKSYLFMRNPEQICLTGGYSYVDDDVIFDFIKSEGPNSLSNSVVKRTINGWMSDKNVALRKLNKLRDCLKEYIFSHSPNNKTLRPGRLKTSIIEELGTKLINDIFQDITSILQIVKKIRRNYSPDGIEELIKQACTDFISSLEEKFEENPNSTEIQEKIIKYTYFIPFNEASTPISECIENDGNLKTWFNTFNWDPNDLAKEIIAKFLNVKKDTITNIVHRKRKPK